MSNHSRRSDVAAAKRFAQAHGFTVREGEYQTGLDNLLGRWYVMHESQEYFDPAGQGHASRGAAWEAAAELAREREAGAALSTTT